MVYFCELAACYIDIDAEEEAEIEDANKVYSKWSTLPDLVLEEIFGYLTAKERYYASLVGKYLEKIMKIKKPTFFRRSVGNGTEHFICPPFGVTT